ncbi:hypothetical protein YC2023_093001 [Brassica napus]
MINYMNTIIVNGNYQRKQILLKETKKDGNIVLIEKIVISWDHKVLEIVFADTFVTSYSITRISTSPITRCKVVAMVVQRISNGVGLLGHCLFTVNVVFSGGGAVGEGRLSGG